MSEDPQPSEQCPLENGQTKASAVKEDSTKQGVYIWIEKLNHEDEFVEIVEIQENSVRNIEHGININQMYVGPKSAAIRGEQLFVAELTHVRVYDFVSGIPLRTIPTLFLPRDTDCCYRFDDEEGDTFGLIVHEDKMFAWGYENIILVDGEDRLSGIGSQDPLLNVCVLERASERTVFIVQLNAKSCPIWRLTTEGSVVTGREKLMDGMWTLLGMCKDILYVQSWSSHDLVAFKGTEEVKRIELKGRADIYHFVGERFYYAYEDADKCCHVAVINLDDGSVYDDIIVAVETSRLRFIPVILEAP